MSLKVAVIMGGASAPQNASQESGKAICQALEAADHKVIPLTVSDELVSTLRAENPDVAFIATSCKFGEAGQIQSALEFLGIPFVGSGSGVCQNTWRKDSLPTTMAVYCAITNELPEASWPQGFTLAREAFECMGAAAALDLVKDRVHGGFPVAVKPVRGCFAQGVHRVDCEEELLAAITDALTYDECVVIQQWVEGVEVAVSVLGTGWDAYALPPVEIVSAGAAEEAEFHAPVRMESLSDDQAEAQAIRAEIERAALDVYRAFGMQDLGRIDMIWDGAQARVLDVAAVPSLADSSLYVRAIESAGLSLPAVANELVYAAYEAGAN